MPSNHLTVIGAGPKGVAIATKARILNRLGFSVPQITILDSAGVGANWRLGTGFTNGRLKLGTSPEKDLGFPYASSCWGDDFNDSVNLEMQKFSWQSFLVAQKGFAAWIDRGRPSPDHMTWAKYLAWAAEKVISDSPFIKLAIASFDRCELTKDNRWQVRATQQNGKAIEFETDGIVLTGPGEINRPDGIPEDPRIMDIQNFWSRIPEMAEVSRKTEVAIIGNGETAASTAVVIGRIDAPLKIDVIASVAMSYSRGESFAESHMYTDPFQGNWHELTETDRRNFIERTDRGVFSLAAKRELDHMEHVSIIPGWFRGIEINSARQLAMDIDYAGVAELRHYDYVIMALGFDVLKFLKSEDQRRTLRMKF